jgi:hypothetical protein
VNFDRLHLQVFHGVQKWHPYFGTLAVALLVLSLLQGKDKWMAFGSASIVAQALHNVRLKGATNTMTQRSMNFVLVKPQQNKW